MVARDRAEQWSPTKWPVSLRWQAAGRGPHTGGHCGGDHCPAERRGGTAELPVVAATQRWAKGHPPGEHAVVNVPADLAALFVHPSKLDGTMAAVGRTGGGAGLAEMLRPLQSADAARNTALMRFTASRDLWPDPGPTAGSQAVFSPSPGGCAAARAHPAGRRRGRS